MTESVITMPECLPKGIATAHHLLNDVFAGKRPASTGAEDDVTAEAGAAKRLKVAA